MLWWKIIYRIFARVETAFRLLANYIQRLLKKKKIATYFNEEETANWRDLHSEQTCTVDAWWGLRTVCSVCGMLAERELVALTEETW